MARMLCLTFISILAFKGDATYGREQEAAEPEVNGSIRGPRPGYRAEPIGKLASCGSLSPRIIPIIISVVKVFIRSTNLSPGIAGLGRSTQAANA